MMEKIQETSINIIAEGTRLEGKVTLDRVSRVYGVLIGEVHAKDGSEVILGEASVVEGTIHADHLIIDGFVRGDIFARGKVVVSRTGRVVGNISTPTLNLEFGAYFEGRCTMEAKAPTPSPEKVEADESLEPAPA